MRIHVNVHTAAILEALMSILVSAQAAVTSVGSTPIHADVRNVGNSADT